MQIEQSLVLGKQGAKPVRYTVLVASRVFAGQQASVKIAIAVPALQAPCLWIGDRHQSELAAK
jgi:hypothetical protein